MSPTGNNWTHRGLWFCILTITIYLITTINILYRWKNKPIMYYIMSQQQYYKIFSISPLLVLPLMEPQLSVSLYALSLYFTLYNYGMFTFQAYPTQQSRIGAATIYYTLKSSMQSTTIYYTILLRFFTKLLLWHTTTTTERPQHLPNWPVDV